MCFMVFFLDVNLRFSLANMGKMKYVHVGKYKYVTLLENIIKVCVFYFPLTFSKMFMFDNIKRKVFSYVYK